MNSSIADRQPPTKPEPTVRQIGNQLMTRYVLPLEVVGLLLTAATIGAVIIAMQETGGKKSNVQPLAPKPVATDPHKEDGKIETGFGARGCTLDFFPPVSCIAMMTAPMV